MSKLLFQIRDDHKNQETSQEYNLSKSKGKRKEKGNGYILSKIDETIGPRKYKLNYFNVKLCTESNYNPEFSSNFINKKTKKLMKKEKFHVKGNKLSPKKESAKEKSNDSNLDIINQTEFEYNYNIPTNIAKDFKKSTSLLNKTYSEIESHLDILWKYLGVNENYISIFNSYKKKLINSEDKKIFVLNEIENLEYFKDITINLSKEIEIRESKIEEIKDLFDRIDEENDLVNLKKILNESYSNIISYFENSVRVVEYYLLFKEIINQGNTKNIKFNEEIIKKIFGISKFGNNYLLKMRTDTNFINIAKINEFKLNKSILNILKADPFLTCLHNIIQLTPELTEKIKYCQYYIIQEGIFDSLYKSLRNPMPIPVKKNPQPHIAIDAGKSKKENKISEGNANINANLDISYFSGKLNEFVPLYSEYFEKIPEEQKLIFNLNKDPMKYFEHNYYPKIIICKDKATDLIKGICIYSVLFKNQQKQPDEIIIEHISSYNQEEMENIITKIIEFIKENNILNDMGKIGNKLNIEIYINLYYYIKNEKFEIDQNIRDFIVKNLKFKWVNLENESNVRFLKVKQIINNEGNNNYDENVNNNCNLCSNLFIKDNFNINLVEKIMMNNENKNDFNIKKINPFNIIYIIYLMKKIYKIKNSFDYLLNKLNKFSIKKDFLLEDANNDIAMSLVLNDNFNSDLNINSLVEDLKSINNCITGNLNNELDLNNKFNISPLFNGCMSIKYKNYFYNRIECKNIKIFIEKTTQQIFYLLNTVNDENINILMSSNLNDDFKKKYLSSGNKSSENNEHFNNINNFEELYNNLEESNSDKKNINKFIYIPAFSIEQKYEQKNVENSNENEKNVINSFNEECKIEFLTEEIIAKKNKKTSNNFEFNITEEEIKNKSEYLIDDEFILFILDWDIIDKIGIIPLMSIDVHKNNFITSM